MLRTDSGLAALFGTPWSPALGTEIPPCYWAAVLLPLYSGGGWPGFSPVGSKTP